MKMIPSIVDVITVLRLIITELPVCINPIGLTVLPDGAGNSLRFVWLDVKATIDNRMVTGTDWREVSNFSD